MNLETIRIQLIRKGLRFKDLSRATGIDYDRLLKVVHGYRRARQEETAVIAQALEVTENAIRDTVDPSGGEIADAPRR